MKNLSKYGFGTAYLHHHLQRKRLDLISCALDNGITHFDTAPYYGYGVGERTLSYFSSENITITTKFGLYPKGGCNQKLPEIYLRKIFGKFSPFAVDKLIKDFSIKKAQESLDSSRFRLNRDYIDFFLIHEPENELLDNPSLVEWLNKQVSLGNILNYGLAGDLSNINSFSKEELSKYSVFQTNYHDMKNLQEKSLSAKAKIIFSYHWMKKIPKEYNKPYSLQENIRKTEDHIECLLFSSSNKKHISEFRI